MANPSRNDWSRLLEDALWAHRIAYTCTYKYKTKEGIVTHIWKATLKMTRFEEATLALGGPMTRGRLKKIQEK
ncbi:hypothetical protein CR513_41607, partial [Mucuna pruriens]